MWQLLKRMLDSTRREAEARFIRWLRVRDMPFTTLAAAVFGGYIGGAILFMLYLLVGAALLWRPRTLDPALEIMLLSAYVLIGTVQGTWLGAATGAAWAQRAQTQYGAAARTCIGNGLLYLTFAYYLYFYCLPDRGRFVLMVLLCGLPFLWASILIAWAFRLDRSEWQ